MTTNLSQMQKLYKHRTLSNINLIRLELCFLSVPSHCHRKVLMYLPFFDQARPLYTLNCSDCVRLPLSPIKAMILKRVIKFLAGSGVYSRETSSNIRIAQFWSALSIESTNS